MCINAVIWTARFIERIWTFWSKPSLRTDCIKNPKAFYVLKFKSPLKIHQLINFFTQIFDI